MSYWENHRRSLAKALTYRLLGASLTATITLLLTHQVGLAATIGLLDVVVKIGGYYFHERVWDRIRYGRVTAENDYEI